MGNQENLKYFLDKPRKELQKLCKSHNLPANRSHVVLAESLASIFKMRSANVTLPGETLVDSGSMSLNESHITEIKSMGTSLEETVKGMQEHQNSSEDYILGRTSDGTEMPSGFMPTWNTINPIEFASKNANLVVEKIVDTVNPVCQSFVNNKSSEGFGSTSAPVPTGVSHIVADSHAPAKVDNLAYFEVGNKKGHKRSLEQGNVDQEFPCHATSDRGTSNDEMLPCGHKRARQSSGLSVSDVGIARKIPSFQFFVTSERGINLYVDFRSSPLEWIKNMKNEQCIHHNNAGHEESPTISDHLSGLPDIEGNIEVLPSGEAETKLHSNGSGDNLGCSNSSLNSVVSENCNSDNSTPDLTAASSRSSVLTLGAVKDNSNTLVENLVSYSSITHIVKNKLTYNHPSCSHEELALTQDCAKASVKMATSKEEASDASLKSVASIDGVNLSPIACNAGHTVHTACTVSVSAEATGPLGQSLVQTTDVLPSASTEKDGMEVLNLAKVQQDVASVEASSMRQQMDNPPCNEDLFSQSPLAAQFPDQILLNPVPDEPSKMEAIDNLLPELPCGVGETLVPNDQTSKFATEMVQSIMPCKNHISEYSGVQSSSNENLKTISNPDFSEGSQITKDFASKENVNGNRASLRSTKNSANRTVSGSVLRRRSSRLLPK